MTIMNISIDFTYWHVMRQSCPKDLPVVELMQSPGELLLRLGKAPPLGVPEGLGVATVCWGVLSRKTLHINRSTQIMSLTHLGQ